MKYKNVNESWFLYDTILISPWVDQLPHAIPGWYNSFVALGGADNLTFFNSRNKSIGLAYNNQESRDQIPYALVAESLSVDFFGPSMANHINNAGVEETEGRLDYIAPWWEAELPQHASMIFRTNQDERLKTSCAMLPPGYGPVGHMRGQQDNSAIGGWSGSVNAGGQGRAHNKFRWEFPTGIGIPRRATIAVQINLVEYARQFLRALWGPGNINFYGHDGTDYNVPVLPALAKPVVFGIQVLITGNREVQQRGEYHA